MEIYTNADYFICLCVLKVFNFLIIEFIIIDVYLKNNKNKIACQCHCQVNHIFNMKYIF